MNKKNLLQYDALRFICAVYIFLFHVHIRWNIFQNKIIHNILDVGPIAMTIFFCLSGFLIAFRYCGTNITQKEFIKRRILRLYPLYILGSLLTLPWLKTDGDFSFYLALLIIFVSCAQSLYVTYFGFWNFDSSWSISVEFWIAFITRKLLTMRGSIKNLIYILISLFAIALVTSGLPQDKNFPYYYSSFLIRIPEFMVGIMAFKLLHGGGRIKTSVLLLSFIFILSIIIFLGNFNSNYLVYSPLVSCFAFLLLIKLYDESFFITRLIFKANTLKILYDLSYSLYITQPFVLNLMKDLLVSVSILTVPLIFLINLAFAYLCHKYFEIPFRAFLLRKNCEYNLRKS